VTKGSTAPSNAFQNFVWAMTDTAGALVRFYAWANGGWAAQHALVPGSMMLWRGALPNFATFDGGDGGALGQYSGPMWRAVTEMDGRFPIGVGALPTPSTTTIALAAQGGEEEHVLSAAEGGAGHMHYTGRYVGTTNYSNCDLVMPTAPNMVVPSMAGMAHHSENVPFAADVSTAAGLITKVFDDPNVTTDAHTNMPPYLGVYFLERTARTHYWEPAT
jgi:hypothetical protein